MFNRILLAVDASSSSEAAVSFAMAMAAQSSGTIRVVHVNEYLVGGRGFTAETQAEAINHLENAVAALHRGRDTDGGVALSHELLRGGEPDRDSGPRLVGRRHRPGLSPSSPFCPVWRKGNARAGDQPHRPSGAYRACTAGGDEREAPSCGRASGSTAGGLSFHLHLNRRSFDRTSGPPHALGEVRIDEGRTVAVLTPDDGKEGFVHLVVAETLVTAVEIARRGRVKAGLG